MVDRPVDVEAGPAAERFAVGRPDQQVVRAARRCHVHDLGELRRRHGEELAASLRHAVYREISAAWSGIVEQVSQRVAVGVSRIEERRNLDVLALALTLALAGLIGWARSQV